MMQAYTCAMYGYTYTPSPIEIQEMRQHIDCGVNPLTGMLISDENPVYCRLCYDSHDKNDPLIVYIDDLRVRLEKHFNIPEKFKKYLNLEFPILEAGITDVDEDVATYGSDYNSFDPSTEKGIFSCVLGFHPLNFPKIIKECPQIVELFQRNDGFDYIAWLRYYDD